MVELPFSNFTSYWFQNLCRNCKRHYCNDCFAKETIFVPGENIRHCLTCRALQYPVAYRDQLKKLKVKDLQDYLRAKQISMNQCKEKGDLIELILRHAEGRSSTSHSTSNPPGGRPQPQANPSQPNSQRPNPSHPNSQRPNQQPRSSNFQPPSNTQPVQVCTFLVNLDTLPSVNAKVPNFTISYLL